MTTEQAQQFADAELKALTQQEREYTITLEGDPTFSVRKKTRVTGTKCDFDTEYYVKTINRVWSREDGFMMTIAGKNSQPENQADVSGAIA